MTITSATENDRRIAIANLSRHQDFASKVYNQALMLWASILSRKCKRLQ